MKIHFFLIAVFIGVASCNFVRENNILSEDEMVNLLIKIHIAEAKVNNSYLPGDSAMVQYKMLEDSIFKTTHTTKVMYDSSYRYYMHHIDIMDLIYARVVDSLSLREGIKKID